MANRTINNRQKVSYRQPPALPTPTPKAKTEKHKRGRLPVPPVVKPCG